MESNGLRSMFCFVNAIQGEEHPNSVLFRFFVTNAGESFHEFMKTEYQVDWKRQK